VSFAKGLDLFWLSGPPKDNLYPESESMPLSVRPGSSDPSKGTISWLRVERKEITFSGASLEMDRIDTSETKGSSGQLQVQHSVSVGHKVSNPLFRHLLKDINPHERDGDRG
jgi:hypothetical protein